MDWIAAIKEIQKAQENDRLVIFVGSGVSINSGIPTWWDLIKKLADAIGYSRCDAACKKKHADCPKTECEDLYAYTQDEFLRIPEYYYQQDTSENHNDYFGLIQGTLQSDNGSNPIDDEIFSILPRHIITTNYDSLLEKSKAANSLLYAVVTQDSDLLAEVSDRYIIKMHGDLEKPDTIVLKESDYINYEQEHPLISTFIKSLLVNHTFVFLGYSLNDNNLNLIIGWINYFRKLHGVKERPANFWIDSKPTSSFEQARLESRNIFVVDLSSLPADLEEKANVPSSITNGIGRKLFTFLRCITNPKITHQYIPIEERLVEKYQLLKSYSKISHQDLIAIHPLGRTQFLNTELIFYDESWYKCIKNILSTTDSIVSVVFRKAGISAIQNYLDGSSFPVSTDREPVDPLFQLYLDNNYVALDTALENCENLVQKMYYSHMLGKGKEYVEALLSSIAELKPPTDYVSVLLYKMRARIATLSHFERQESKTLELQRTLSSPPEQYKNAVSFLRMLFNSPAENMQKMDKLLSKHENRYAFNNKTIYSAHIHINLWELKAFAYDYYFFFKKNGIPLDYFSEPKEYLSYYLKALLCSYSPNPPDDRNSDIFGNLVCKAERNYLISEVDLDMLVKFTSPKMLKSWLRKYTVQKLKIQEGVDVTPKFVNLCASLTHFRIKYWFEKIHCFAIILCLVDLDEDRKHTIFRALANIVIEASKSEPIIVEEVFETIEMVIEYISIQGVCTEKTLLLDSLLADTIYPLLIERKNTSFGRILNNWADEVSPEAREKIKQHIDGIDDISDRVKRLHFFRALYSKEFCTTFFQEHMDQLSPEQIFALLIDKIVPFDERCWTKFINTLKKEDEERKSHPMTRIYPDRLMQTIKNCMILKLLGFEIDLASLAPYTHYSEHLSFMVNPDAFNYSLVNTEDYMWQNLIYSPNYQPYFIAHKSEVLSDNLRKIFDLGLASKNQQKIVYGILLDQNELQHF